MLSYIKNKKKNNYALVPPCLGEGWQVLWGWQPCLSKLALHRTSNCMQCRASLKPLSKRHDVL